MPAYQRSDISKVLTAIKQGKPCSVYLLIGDRYLCLQVADQVAAALIPDLVVRGQSVNHIDGDQEDPINTLNHLKTYSMFTGRQIFRVSDSKLFHSKEVAKTIWDKAVAAHGKNNSRQARSYLSQLAAIAQVAIDDLAEMTGGQWQSAFDFAKADTGWLSEVLSVGEKLPSPRSSAGTDSADLYMSALEDGLPDDNILLLLAENVDKRKKLYKCILKLGIVIDLAVADGSSKAARSEQDALLADLVRQTLAGLDKSMEPRAVTLLLERVGFHPVAAVREAEKLALYVGEAHQVTVADVKAMVSRTREDALYELTEAFTDRDLSRAGIIASRLFASGVHPLVMISGLRNQVRKLMLVASLRRGGQAEYVEGMTFPVFQKGFLPALKVDREEWLAQLPTHPYALYMMFEKAGKYSIVQLGGILHQLLAAEFKLKSTGLPPLLVIENFFWQTMLAVQARKK